MNDKTVDLNYAESWVSRPDVCRCCLSASGTWDVTASYVTENGQKEVYSEILQECFGITLSYLLQFGPSRMVCQLCVGHLRDANNFRKQVTQAEQLFDEYCTRSRLTFKPVVLNIAEDALEKDLDNISNSSKADSVDRTIDALTESNQITRRGTVKKRKRSSTIQKKEIAVAKEGELEMDTPLSVILEKNHSVFNVASDGIDSVGRKCFIYTRPQNDTKQVSERRRVMVTCETILKDTTACPFRHHKSWFQCFFCQQEFMEINLLRSHTQTTHSNIDDELKKIKRYPRSLQIEITNLECRECHLSLTDVSSMRGHLVDVHKKVIYKECIADYKVNGSPYSCHLCGLQFHVFRSLTTHLNEHYANCICDVCGKSFLNSKRLKVHKRTHESGHFPCSECGKVLKTKTSITNHMESAHSKRVIKCQICLKPMKHYNDRIKHMSEVHNITHKFKCPICDREYNIKHYLATHIRQTHGHKNKKCIDCGMGFITNHALKKHMLKHTGIKPFSCSICCKSYARSHSLRDHMRAHDNEKVLVNE
ncbi:uncharacterized protein LOC142985261 [Anticarsia gemmatalis]|uniref:uncharacterized protein LOC142985261 n=1 Tax=Anticarsia gemmatalis TaxID=129554 RepID=UPI003F75BA75